jgi:hypothetical protein
MSSMPRLIASAIALSVALAVAGCAQPYLHDGFGDALRMNIANQMAPPVAAASKPAPPTSGERVELAQKRYTTGTTIAPSTAGAAAAVKSDGGKSPSMPGTP